MDVSARLSLPYMLPAQAQKHVTHNTALERLDLLVQLAVETFDATTPPTVPTEGAVWALGAFPTGAWDGPTWVFIAPSVGWVAADKDQETLRLRTDTGWMPLAQVALDDLEGVGIGTSHDSINRLAWRQRRRFSHMSARGINSS